MKYKVTFESKETYYIIVEAEDENEADDKASEMFSNGEYTENQDQETVSISVESIENKNKHKNNEILPGITEESLIKESLE